MTAAATSSSSPRASHLLPEPAYRQTLEWAKPDRDLARIASGDADSIGLVLEVEGYVSGLYLGISTAKKAARNKSRRPAGARRGAAR